MIALAPNRTPRKPLAAGTMQGSSLPADHQHETNVREFMASAEVSDPDRYAEACAKYPTLSESALMQIRKREIGGAFAPSLEGGEDGDDMNLDDYEAFVATAEASMMRPPLRP